VARRERRRDVDARRSDRPVDVCRADAVLPAHREAVVAGLLTECDAGVDAALAGELGERRCVGLLDRLALLGE